MKKYCLTFFLCLLAIQSAYPYSYCDECDYSDWCNIFYLHRRGAYVAASGSYDWYNSMRLDSTLSAGTPVNITQSARADSSYNINGSIGYMVDHWRLEIEGSYRDADENAAITHSSGGVDQVLIGEYSHVGKYSIMANAIFDLPIFRQEFMLYGGAGVGVAFSDSNIRGTVDGQAFRADRDNVHFAWQLLAGMSYKVAPCVDLTAGYRFFGMTSQSDITQGSYTLKFHNTPIAQSVEVGIRFSFR